jgi:prolyl oligopeptidase
MTAPTGGAGAPPRLPATRAEEVVDDYHGTRVADPYRWLEDSGSAEVEAWVEAQNAVTRAWLEAVPDRDAIRRRLEEIWNTPRCGVPARRGPRLFFQRNSGLQDQAVLFCQDSPDSVPRAVLDPNEWSADGTVALTNLAITDDGRLLAYGRSAAGSDWQEIRVRDAVTGADLPDRVRFVKFSEVAWSRDAAGFFYARYPDPAEVPEGDPRSRQRLHYHRLGEPQEADRLVYERPDEPLAGVSPAVSDDGRWLVIHVSRGTDKDNEIVVQRLDRNAGPPRPLLEGFDASHHWLGTVGDTFYFRTDAGAPRGRVIAVDAGRPAPADRIQVLPEGDDVLDFGALAGGRLVVARLRDAHHRLAIHTLDGAPAGDLALPTLGSVTGLSGRLDQEELYVGFTSFVHPGSVYRVAPATGAVRPWFEPRTAFDPGGFEARQVFFRSKDGTRVPMFLVQARDLPAGGDRPVRLTGYGGFNISLTPAFSPAAIVWLERGGVLAVANLRGGAEYGEAWHAAGMGALKQNVFDDFIAAAEHLIASGVTRPGRLAILGGSNGGLLTAACVAQRPELFGAVVSQVPVVDMLRYHRWTIGRYWIPEYGCADDPAQFRTLLAYSPYHNLREGPYPPILITTGEGDDRVHPAHARKLAAMLQARNTSGAPILLRVERRAGHGAGKPTSKVIEEAADVGAFLLRALGLG